MPSPPDAASGRPTAVDPRAPRRPGRMARWVRRPALAVALLAVAVAVSVVEGQPPPAARDSGVSVNAVQSYTRPVGTLLVVADGKLIRFDTADRRARSVPLPRGLTALRAWTQGGRDVVLGRLPTGRTAAYLLAPGRAPTALGPAEVAVPTADRGGVWLVSRRVATLVPLGGGARRTVPLPKSTRLVGDTPYGLIVSSGTVPDPQLPGRRPTPTPRTTPTLTPPGTPGVPSPTPPAGTLSGDTGSGRPTGPSAAGTSVPPTTPPYTTASPVPSTGPNGVPLTTLVVSRTGSARFVAAAEAVAVAGDVVLIRDDDRRLGVISPRPGLRVPRWLPNPSAVEVIGPGSLDARGRTFAVLARTNDYARLIVGPTTARTGAAINNVALDGGPPRPDAAPPAFTASGRVLAARPDGRVVYFTPGERAGYLLGDDLPAASAVTQA